MVKFQTTTDRPCKESYVGNGLVIWDGDRSLSIQLWSVEFTSDNKESLKVFEKEVSWPKLYFGEITLPAGEGIFIITINFSDFYNS